MGRSEDNNMRRCARGGAQNLWVRCIFRLVNEEYINLVEHFLHELCGTSSDHVEAPPECGGGRAWRTWITKCFFGIHSGKAKERSSCPEREPEMVRQIVQARAGIRPYLTIGSDVGVVDRC